MPKPAQNRNRPTPIHRGRPDVSPLRQHYFELLSDPLAFLADVSSLLTVMDPRTRSLPGEPEPVTDLDGFLDMVVDDVGIETTALLVVLGRLAPAPYSRRAAQAAARRADPLLPWVAGLADARVVDAGRMQDVYGDSVDYVFEVRSPEVPVFCQLVHVDRRVGSAVVDAFFVDRTLDDLRHRSLDEADLEHVVWLGVDRAAARGVVEAGIEMSMMLLPRPETDSWPMSRAMTEWVLRMLPPADAVPDRAMGGPAREALIQDFLGSPAGRKLDHDKGGRIVRSVVEMAVEFAVSYGTGDPLEWSPRGIDDFFGWWAHKVVAPGLDADVPQVLVTWVEFALHRKGLDQRFVDDAVDAAQDLGAGFLVGRYHRPEPGGGLMDDLFGSGSLGPWGSRLDLTPGELPLAVGDNVGELTADPLPDEAFDWSGVPDDIHDRVGDVLEMIDRGAAVYEEEGAEVRTAQRRLLARAAREAPEWFSPKSKSTGSANAICWLIGKANNLLSAYGPVTAGGLAAAVGASGSGSQRAYRLQKMLGMPSVDYRVFLADAALLIGEHRSELIELRDAT